MKETKGKTIIRRVNRLQITCERVRLQPVVGTVEIRDGHDQFCENLGRVYRFRFDREGSIIPVVTPVESVQSLRLQTNLAPK